MECLLLYSAEKFSHISASAKQAKTEQKWEIGQIIDDRYEIQDIIAQDSRKVIHKVRHCQWNIPLAVRSQIDKKTQVQFFHQAARWVELDKHPNVVSAYYVQNIGGVPRLFVEYVKSKTLQQLMLAESFDLEAILDIVIQTCWGMDHAHKKSLLHGDLRPGNIFITDEREVKITDFRSRENTNLEWSPYMPPEQFDKDRPAQLAIDIYALGAILYELCVGQLPCKIDFELKSEQALDQFKNLLLTQSPREPHKVDGKIPESLSNLIMQCLAVNPEERPRHFEDVSERLLQIYPEVTGFPYPRKAPDAAMLAAVDLNNRALSLLDLGQKKEAQEYLEQAVAASSLCTGARINLYLLWLQSGKASLAEFRSATQSLLASDREVTTFYRAKVCLGKGGFLEESLQEVMTALDMFPNNKELVRLQGMLLRRLCQYEKASAVLQELVESAEVPSWQDIYQLAFCYLELGQKQKAKQVLEKGLGIYPDDLYLMSAMGVATALQGKLEDAHVYFMQLVTRTNHFWPMLHLAEIAAAFGDYIKTYGKATPAPDEAHKLYEGLFQKAPRLPRVLRGYLNALQKSLPETIDKKNEEVRPLWSYVRGLAGHNEGIHCMVLSPDGRLVVSGGADKYLRIWDIASGTCKNTITAHAEGTTQICISQDGHFIVSIGRDNVAMVWDIIAGECVARLEGHARDITSIALTATGYLVTGSLDRTLRIWDLGALSCRNILKGHQDKINCVAVTPDGRLAISGGEDTRIGLWDMELGAIINFLDGHQDGVTCLAVSPDGRWLVSGGWDQKIKVFELPSGKLVKVLEGHSGTLNCLSITPDSKRLISGGEDKIVRVWGLPDGQKIYNLEGHTVDITCVAVSPCSRFMVSGSWDHTLRVWDLNYGECLGVLEGHTDLVNSVAITPYERFILSGGDDPVLRVWMDLTTLNCAPVPDPPLSYLLQRPPSQHGNLEEKRRVQKLLAQAQTKLHENSIAEAMEIYREVQTIEEFAHNSRVINAIYQAAHQGGLQRKRPRAIWQDKVLAEHNGQLTCIAISPKEEILITGSKDNSLKVWDTQQKDCIRTLEGHKGPIACIDISPNGRFVVSGSHDNTLRLWELETGRCIYSMEGHGHWVEHTRFTPDGRRIVSASRDTSVRIWERKTGHRIYTLNAHTDLISTLLISGDGRFLVSASHDRTVRVWELESGQCVSTIEKHNDHVKCVVCLPNTNLAVSGGWDCVLHMWNIENGDCLSSFTGHTGWINEICVTPDGSKIISCSLDKTVRVWDVASGECLATLHGHTQDVNHIVVTSDGKFCISSSWDNSLRVWDLVTYQCCRVLEGHNDVIVALHTIHNNRYAVTGSKDQKLIFWQIDWDWE